MIFAAELLLLFGKLSMADDLQVDRLIRHYLTWE